jgi:sugar lactone lactonase YvrE
MFESVARACGSLRAHLGGALAALAVAFSVSLAPALAAPALFITDDTGLVRYDFQGGTFGTLIPEGGDSYNMTGVAIGPNGNLFVAATNVSQVYEYDTLSGARIGSGPFVPYYGQPPTPDPRDVINPQGMRFGPNGNLYIADLSGATTNVHEYDATGTSVGALTSPMLNQPSDVAFDSAGNLYVTNPGSANVLVSAGANQPFVDFVGVQSGGLNNPTALTFGPNGKLYVIDPSTSALYRYNSDGSFDTTLISFGLFQPAALAFGPDGNLYVSGTDIWNNLGQVLRYSADGVPDGALIASGLTNPRFLAFVPEPTTAVLLGGLGLTLLRRRTR